jgi:hypothetical protein
MIISRSATFAARAPKLTASWQHFQQRINQRFDQRAQRFRRMWSRRPSSGAALSVPGTTAPISVASAAPVSAAVVPAPTTVVLPSGPVPQYLTGLGFSLKPPAWLRNFAGAVIKGTTISVPTPSGIPIVVDGSDPNAYQKILAMFRGTTVSTQAGTPSPSIPQRAAQAIQNIPGGWLTVGALALGAIMLSKNRR